MSTVITAYGRGALAQAPIPPNPYLYSVVVGQLAASDRYDASSADTELKVDAAAPPANSVRKEYVLSSDDYVAQGDGVRVNLYLTGADAIYLDETGLMFRDAQGNDHAALIDARTATPRRYKAAGADLLVSVGWQIVDGAPTDPTFTVHPWSAASETAQGLTRLPTDAQLQAALDGTDPPSAIEKRTPTLQNWYANRDRPRAGTGNYGKVQLATAAELTAALGGADPPDADADKVPTLQTLYDNLSALASVAGGGNLGAVPKVILYNTLTGWANGGNAALHGLAFPTGSGANATQWLDGSKIAVQSFDPLDGCTAVSGGLYFDWDDATIVSVDAIIEMNGALYRSGVGYNAPFANAPRRPMFFTKSTGDFLEDGDWVSQDMSPQGEGHVHDTVWMNRWRSKPVRINRNDYLLFSWPTAQDGNQQEQFSLEVYPLQINRS